MRDRQLDRICALKILIPTHSVDSSGPQRFLRECQILSQIHHPNVLKLFSAGQAETLPWMLTELLDGRSLEVPPLPADLKHFVHSVSLGLDALHKKGIIHRDVKPANIFETKDGRYVLIDLGLGKTSEEQALTATGAVLGTMAYLAPECFRGADASPAADWYALGATLYWLLEGQAPFTPSELIEAGRGTHLKLKWNKPPADPEIRALTESLLATDPQKRPHSAAEVAKALGFSTGSLVNSSSSGRLQPPKTPIADGISAESGAFSLSRSRPSSGPMTPPASSPPASPSSFHKTFPAFLLVLFCLLLGWGGWGLVGKQGVATATPTSVPLPAPKPVAIPSGLLQRGKFFGEFHENYNPYASHLVEPYIADILPQFSNRAVGQKWRGYLGELRDWLIQETREIPSSEKIDAFLGSPQMLPHFKKYALEIPTPFLSALGFSFKYLINPAFSPKTPELYQSLTEIGKKRNHVLKLYTEVREFTQSWLQNLPPQLRQSRAIQTIRWPWMRRINPRSLHEEHSILFDVLLPHIRSNPLGEKALESSLTYLNDPTYKDFNGCPKRISNYVAFWKAEPLVPATKEGRIRIWREAIYAAAKLRRCASSELEKRATEKETILNRARAQGLTQKDLTWISHSP